MTAGLGSGRGAFARRSRDENARDEEGFTLIEILITVWIMGAVMVAFMGALFTMVRSSDVNNRTTIAEAELRKYAEAVRALPFNRCWTAANYRAALTSAGYTPVTGATPDITGVTYWNTGDALGTFGATCNANKNSSQRVSLQVQVGSSPVITATTTIDKRDNQVGAQP